jgi:hypothetical protein
VPCARGIKKQANPKVSLPGRISSMRFAVVSKPFYKSGWLVFHGIGIHIGFTDIECQNGSRKDGCFGFLAYHTITRGIGFLLKETQIRGQYLRHQCKKSVLSALVVRHQ